MGEAANTARSKISVCNWVYSNGISVIGQWAARALLEPLGGQPPQRSGRPGTGVSGGRGERCRNGFARRETEFRSLVRDDQLGFPSQQIDRSLWCEVHFQPLASYC